MITRLDQQIEIDKRDDRSVRCCCLLFGRLTFFEFLEGFRHPVQSTVVRTTRVLSTLLSIVAKSESHDKFKVTATSVPYLAALVSVVEEVRTRCTIKTRLNVLPATANASEVATNLGTSMLGSSPIGHPFASSLQSQFDASVDDNTGPNVILVQAGPRTLKPSDPLHINRTRNMAGMSTSPSIAPYDRYSQWMDVRNIMRPIVRKPPSRLTYLQPVKSTIPIVVTPQILLEPQQTLRVRQMPSIFDRAHRMASILGERRGQSAARLERVDRHVHSSASADYVSNSCSQYVGRERNANHLRVSLGVECGLSQSLPGDSQSLGCQNQLASLSLAR